MPRLVAAACLSVLLYLLLFGFMARFPLSRGLLEVEMDQKIARLGLLASPKFVIMAGSNAPFSHSCAVFAAAFAMPCENAGVSVTFGLDASLPRVLAGLRAGDVVYLPIELPLYAATRADFARDPDGQMLWRDDKPRLAGLAPSRQAGAVFCCNALDLVEAAIELPLSHLKALDAGRIVAGEYDGAGDRIDNGGPPAFAVAPAHDDPPAVVMARGYGAQMVARFVAAARARGVRVIGGLPTEAGGDVSAGQLAAVRAVYGDDFVALPNASHYPVADFYNSPDHLLHACALLHSMALVPLLAARLHRQPAPVPETLQRGAAQCPSALNVARN
jgi:hypothetical protein